MVYSAAMNDSAPLASLRRRLAALPGWLVAMLAVAYAISQATILAILHPLGPSIAKLQCCAFTADAYIATFRAWESAGVLSAYRAHFVLDDVHWIWYSLLATALLCRLFERQRVPHRYDFVLVLPLVSGLCDAYENHLQHVFLSAPDYSTIVDPLPLLSTLASDAKWALAAGYVLLITGLFVRGRLHGRAAARA